MLGAELLGLKDVARETRFAAKLLKVGPGKVPLPRARQPYKRRPA